MIKEDNSITDTSSIDMQNIFKLIFEKKVLLSTLTIFFALLSFVYSLFLPNIYQSKSILVPAFSQNSILASSSNFSAVADMAGFKFPAENNNKTKEAIERIKSYHFFENYFLPNIRFENLVAIVGWESSTNEFIYDKNIYDINTKKWNMSINEGGKPSNQEAFEIYNEKVKIFENKSTSFVSITVEHYSPDIAKKWVNVIIENINENMRSQDQELAQNSINFLSKTIDSLNIKSLIDASSRIVEEQMKILMISSSNPEYIFKVLDPPISPEKISSPNRLLICIIGTFLGALVSILTITVLHYKDKIYMK